MLDAGLPFKKVDTLKKIVGGHIRQLRKEHGFRTVEAFAEALGVHPNSVGELERGANWLSPEMLEKMVICLNIPMAAFLPGAERISKPSPTTEALLEKLADQQLEIRELKARIATLEQQLAQAKEGQPKADESMPVAGGKFSDIVAALPKLDPDIVLGFREVIEHQLGRQAAKRPKEKRRD